MAVLSSRVEELDGRLLFIICLYSALAITGLLGNLWVMFTVSCQLAGCCLTSHRQRPVKNTVQSSAYIYLLILSVVDLVSFVSVPLLVTDILENKWPFSAGLCKLLFFCEGMNKTLSPLILTALSLDRYVAVCRPTLLWMRQSKFALFTILLCFSSSLFFITPITLNASILRMQNQKLEEVDKCTVDFPLGDAFDIAHVMCCYFAPLLLICSVYVAILRKLYRHTRRSTVGRKTSISLSRVVRCSVMVVAFYFICWTPYWTMRFFEFIKPASSPEDELLPPVMPSAVPHATSAANGSATDEMPESEEPEMEIMTESRIFFMYLLHSLPYAQSAFNWLFYAFLNRNLRNSGGRSSNTARSTIPTSTAFDNPLSSNTTPLWKSLQQMGSQLRTAGVDTGQLLLKRSPFRSRSRVQSRSSTYLGAVDGNHLCSSLLDIGDRRSATLTPRTEPSLGLSSAKCVSFSDLPRNGHLLEETRPLSEEAPAILITPPSSLPVPTSPPPTPSAHPDQPLPTESGSVEWL